MPSVDTIIIQNIMFQNVKIFAPSSGGHYNYTVHNNFLWLTGSKHL